MSRITDYGFLFQTTFGTSKTNLVNNIQLSQMNSSSVQKQLKAAGIDTNSKKYKAVLSEMMKNGNGAMFTNVQAIKNLMKQFDSEGDLLNANGVAGMDVTGKGTSWQQLTSVSEEYRQKMFDNVKREFIKENGISNGDTTKRSDIFKDYQLSVSKDKRLSGTWTLEQYEGQYRVAMYAKSEIG